MSIAAATSAQINNAEYTVQGIQTFMHDLLLENPLFPVILGDGIKVSDVDWQECDVR